VASRTLPGPLPDSRRSTLSLDMTEIVSERDIAGEGEDGWRVEYRVRCDDGREVLVVAACARTAESSIRSDDGRAFLADQGRAKAIEEADKSQPDATRIRLWVDHVNGSVRVSRST
jgi:hypothetical protein